MNSFVIRGARGTMPVSGREFLTYGGNTTCFSVHTSGGLILFDAGTGISLLSRELRDLPGLPPLTLFFTHLHTDHLIGLPGFEPLYSPRTEISILADPRRPDNWQRSLRAFMSAPYWPIGLGETQAAMTLRDLPVKRDALDLHGISISWFRVPHPQHCLAYRIDLDGTSVVIATDVEYAPEEIDPAFVTFCRGATFLLFDAQYTPAEYPHHRGWGHSTWETAVRLARECGAERLVLTHHAPARTDAEIEEIVTEAAQDFPAVSAARENTPLLPHPA